MTAGDVRIDRTVIPGTFSLDGGTWDVENNLWVVGNDEVCVVVDAPHGAAPIIELVAGRRIIGVLLTHGHDDHIGAAVDLTTATKARSYLNAADRMLWDRVHDEPPSADLVDGDRFEVGDVELEVLHTPGHSPGSCCLYAEKLGVVFTGDTLFQGGPGATGRSFSDHDQIVASIRERLLTLPPATRILTGHGDESTVAAEAENV